MKEGEDRLVAKEYRLIPLEAESNDNEWQLKSLIAQAWEYKKVGAIMLLVAGVVGLVVALTKPDGYQVRSVLLVETSGGQAGDLLRSYGGLLGLGGGMLDEAGSISPELYPDVISSLPFQLELIEKELYFASYDTTVDIYTFYTQIYEPGIYHTLKEYTVGLNSLEGQMGNRSADPMHNGWKKTEVFNIPSSQRAVARGMNEIFEISVEDNKLTIEAWLPDPSGASQFVNLVRETLSSYIIEYKTEKALQDLQFIEQQFQRAKKNFMLAQEALATFRDANRNLATAKATTELERLESEYNLAFGIYSNLAQQLEQARIKVQKDTPVFSTLEPPVLPTSPNIPDRISILVLSIFLGLFLAIIVIGGIIVGKNLIKNFESL
jgi:hypothetical protein